MTRAAWQPLLVDSTSRAGYPVAEVLLELDRHVQFFYAIIAYAAAAVAEPVAELAAAPSLLQLLPRHRRPSPRRRSAPILGRQRRV